MKPLSKRGDSLKLVESWGQHLEEVRQEANLIRRTEREKVIEASRKTGCERGVEMVRESFWRGFHSRILVRGNCHLGVLFKGEGQVRVKASKNGQGLEQGRGG